MSDDAFKLEPADAAPSDDAAAAATPRRRRLRGRGRKDPEGEPRATAARPWPFLLVAPLISATSYYLIGFLLLLTVLLSLFNPFFGHLASYWPHEVLGMGSLPFEWNGVTVRAACIVTVLLGYVIALLMKPGTTRAIVVATVSFLAFVTFQPEPANVRYYVLPTAIAITAGALIVRPDPGRAWIRMGVLIVGLALLAAHLFMPMDAKRIAEKQLLPGYYSTAAATIDYYVNPPDIVMTPVEGEEPSNVVTSYGNLFLLHVPGTIACLLLVVGLLALLGLGGAWARWAAGFLVVSMVLAWGLAHYLHGRQDISEAALQTWQAGLKALGEHWHQSSMAYALPFAGAVAELVRGRSEG